MATTGEVLRPGFKWQTRATWSARDDRWAFAVWLGLLWLGILAGFGVDMPRFVHENPPPPPVVYVHAFFFTGWMLLLTSQVFLVTGGRVAWHRKLGWITAGWACAMLVLGPWAAMASYAVNLQNPHTTPASFLSVQLGDMVCFVLFVAWGIALRKNPAAHKRIMILSTIPLVDAGYGRFSNWLWPTEPTSMAVWFFWSFYGSVMLMVLMTAWDWWRGRLMKQFALGALSMVGAEIVEMLLYFWVPWREATVSWVHAWARVMG